MKVLDLAIVTTFIYSTMLGLTGLVLGKARVFYFPYVHIDAYSFTLVMFGLAGLVMFYLYGRACVALVLISGAIQEISWTALYELTHPGYFVDQSLNPIPDYLKYGYQWAMVLALVVGLIIWHRSGGVLRFAYESIVFPVYVACYVLVGMPTIVLNRASPIYEGFYVLACLLFTVATFHIKRLNNELNGS